MPLDSSTAFVVQEAQGSPADLHHLPTTRVHFGAFGEIEATAAASRAGPIMVQVSA